MVSVGGGQATLATGDRVAELETLSVAGGERGRGVGRALMDAAYAVMDELGATEVMLYVLDGNDDAIRFYERYGLRPYLHVMLGPAGDRGRSPRTPARVVRPVVREAADHPEGEDGVRARPEQSRGLALDDERAVAAGVEVKGRQVAGR